MIITLSAVFMIVIILAVVFIIIQNNKLFNPKASKRSIDFNNDEPSIGTVVLAPESIPVFSGDDYIILNENVPNFTEYDINHVSGEHYSDLDDLGRCGTAYALLESSMLPKADRGGIGMIRPSGWHTVKYPEVIEDNYLYNRCHLIAYSLTGQNANEKNLITGTRYLNKVGMLPFEMEVLRVVSSSDNHVLYRVTPFFYENELVARGVEIEAMSVEDQGMELCFHVFVYNYQPGIKIDYKTGESCME